MLTSLNLSRGKQASVLVVAPHADDETLGAGGTIARCVAEGHNVSVVLMTGRGDKPHPLYSDNFFDVVRAEFRRAMNVLGVTDLHYEELPTTLLTEVSTYKINEICLNVLTKINPDIVILPFEHDLHKDHGLLNYAFRVALRPHLALNRRPHLVLSYEVPTETHLQPPGMAPSFEPHFWCDVSEYINTKTRALSCFESQISPGPALRSLQAIRALATWRGAQIGVDAAEAFMIHRLVA